MSDTVCFILMGVCLGLLHQWWKVRRSTKTLTFKQRRRPWE